MAEDMDLSNSDSETCSPKPCPEFKRTGKCNCIDKCKLWNNSKFTAELRLSTSEKSIGEVKQGKDTSTLDEDFWWEYISPDIYVDRPYYEPDTFAIWYLQELLNDENIDKDEVSTYLLRFETSLVAEAIKEHAECSLDPLFFAVAANRLDVVELLINYGCNVNAVNVRPESKMPLLAFAILHGHDLRDTTEIVRTLLAHGADPSVIGTELFSSLGEPGNSVKHYFPKSKNAAWCTESIWEALRTSLNITQKYLLNKATKLPIPSPRRKQVATAFHYESLFQVPFNLIGQDAAVQELITALLAHSLLDRTKPLVVVFAGPSGHGKTELARQMGALLSLPLCTIDCTEMYYKTDLLGPKAPYQGHEKGSLMNNFLSENAGKPCIVFLDEFEKCGEDVHEALLLPFDEGTYRDQRQSADAAIDCRKVIWILTTNCADEEIQKYYSQHEEELMDPLSLPLKDRMELISVLETRILKTILKPRFGAPFTGRITRVIPFFPFSPREQLIVGAKYLWALKKELAREISLCEADPYLLRHSSLTFESSDLEVYQVLVEGEYDRTLGARSISNAVKRKVKQEIVKEWLLKDALIEEMDNLQPLRKCNFKLGVRSIKEGEKTLVVRLEDGSV
ncbi:P-loop containing nucleoside triphosphate hydrolase protein [Sphaerosporella brunnea]|uniref:P-loop containing nucleoside triphosphate hydrolase protein n=1 Tax=Sphaerosporella brunnea TaxID=1250544 RepID=A0A5J5EZE2_9PEZI|nr:P-loop containing nucleoside triphosphate hydrolase protein [Sphaerosporella brunnea]